jgi:hypothetical protein
VIAKGTQIHLKRQDQAFWKSEKAMHEDLRSYAHRSYERHLPQKLCLF